MNKMQLNEYIMNYVNNDKTQRAIMLTAPWGTGKSYYIKNELCPFLLNKKLNYAVVSLYGLSDIKELNKNIYIEFRTRKIKESELTQKAAKKGGKEIGAAVACLSNTIVKGVASFFNVSLEVSDNDLERLFKSTSLDGKLLILEDVERSGIDIIEVLGYVNNLVENDNAKVLLVCNENEIMQYNTNSDNKGEKSATPTEFTQKYLKIKEKTVGDTVRFVSQYQETITNIYNQFDNKYFKDIINNPSSELTVVEKIELIMKGFNNYNFRSLIYALQRMEDVVNRFGEKTFDLEFVENMLLGTVAFCVKGNQNNNVKWEEFSATSGPLGTFAYPMYKLMFDFIKYQQFRLEDANYMEGIFLKAKACSIQDENLQIIYNYTVQSEKDVKRAIDKLHEALLLNTGIQVSEYIRIANYLIGIKHILIDYNKVDDCLSLLLSNAEDALKKGAKVEISLISGIQYDAKEAVEEFIVFQNKLKEIVSNNSSYVFDFDYTPESLDEFCNNIVTNDTYYINKNGFANKLKLEIFIDMLYKCNAKQLQTVRQIFHSIYRFSNVSDFFRVDLDALQEIQRQVKLLVENNQEIDAIQRKQLVWFDNNLQEIIERISK